MSPDARAARREFFSARFPAIASRLAQGAGEQFSVVTKDGEAVDIRIDNQQMYGGDARRFAAEQLAAYMEKPLRIFMNKLTNSGLVSPVCVQLVAALNDHLIGLGHETLASHPVDNPTFLIVFGLGLGHHLEELARRSKARWLVLVEPVVGFFEHSFRTVDWEALTHLFEERGGEVHIVTEIDPGAIAASVTRCMDAHGIAYADGAWVFTHYPLWAFAEARKRLHEAIEFAFINRGFFEDELRMMTNAVENLSQREFHLLEGKPRLARPEMAVIAGAGPSLDEGFETLHRIRDRVVLFSCGTALRPLLRNRLVPDFHCELENIPEVFDVIGEATKYGDLGRIRLIASATVDPRVPPLFGRTIFFFRDSVSSTKILNGPYSILSGASPTCVNVGMVAAAYLGFTNFTLFGTDCGIRPGGKIHAEGTIYRDLGLWQDKERAKSHPIEVEGNFGGVVRTDWVYDACRLMLASAIGRHRFNVVNCSDGALIPGARPCVPDAVEIAGPVIDHQSLARALEGGMRHFQPGEILSETDLGAVRHQADLLFERLGAVLDELDAGEADFAADYGRIKQLLAEIEGQYLNSDAMVSGTLNALPRIAMFYGFRVADAGGPTGALSALYRRVPRHCRGHGGPDARVVRWTGAPRRAGASGSGEERKDRRRSLLRCSAGGADGGLQRLEHRSVGLRRILRGRDHGRDRRRVAQRQLDEMRLVLRQLGQLESFRRDLQLLRLLRLLLL